VCSPGINIIMSSVGVADEVCANCGKAAVDEVKLKICTACKLVKYCSVVCQKNHRKQHKKACKKRAAEIRDDKLFTLPDESHLGECPICCLPVPLDTTKSVINSCCCKRICDGCDCVNMRREKEQGLEHKCPYCREAVPETVEEAEKILMKRAKANDPNALLKMGFECKYEGDYDGAFQYWTKAAGLGGIEAHYNLSCLYREGRGVERDEKKGVYHAEEAAIAGHPSARYNLGVHEWNSGRYDRAVKHYIIAAKLGHDAALEEVKSNFRRGFVSKEDFEAALSGHQSAVDAAKSEQRDAAERILSDRW
jgi:tetratricopeptide (TPR) repeat protein